MLLVDSKANKLLMVSAAGVVVQESRPALSSSTDLLLGITRLNPNYLIMLRGAAVVVEPRNMGIVGRGNLQHNTDSSSTGLGTITGSTAFGNELLVYGSHPLAGSGSFELGFIVATIHETRATHSGSAVASVTVGDVRVLQEFSHNQYYVIGYQYLASNNLGSYFLAMHDDVHLYWYAPGTRRLQEVTNLPPSYQKAPPLQTPLDGPYDEPAHFSEIEGLSMPVGIYGDGDFVYLLTRERSKAIAGTLWMLHKIDPKHNQTLGSLRIPTHAAHLTVVPTPHAWFFFEKGVVKSALGQEINSLLAIPGDWIRTLEGSPLTAAKPEPLCQEGEPAKAKGGPSGTKRLAAKGSRSLVAQPAAMETLWKR